jgi:hypothetical protein
MAANLGRANEDWLLIHNNNNDRPYMSTCGSSATAS